MGDDGYAGAMAVAPEAAPNVVSSLAAEGDGRHRVGPLRLRGGGAPDWGEVRRVVETALPRVRVVDDDGEGRLRVECRSLVFRFVDDLWLWWRPGAAAIEVCSASRVGYSDLGVNRRRVERLRAALEAARVCG